MLRASAANTGIASLDGYWAAGLSRGDSSVASSPVPHFSRTLVPPRLPPFPPLPSPVGIDDDGRFSLFPLPSGNSAPPAASNKRPGPDKFIKEPEPRPDQTVSRPGALLVREAVGGVPELANLFVYKGLPFSPGRLRRDATRRVVRPSGSLWPWQGKIGAYPAGPGRLKSPSRGISIKAIGGYCGSAIVSKRHGLIAF